MKRKTLIAIGLTVATTVGGAAFAAGNHGGAGKGANAGMMGEHSNMMQMMEQMHKNMMGAMGGQGMMGGMGGQGMLGGGPMLGGLLKQFDADKDGNLTPEEVRNGLQENLSTYDENADGTLSIEEFEVLHSAMIRRTMVDRFQHLDGDGDGKITAVEIVVPAAQLDRMQTMRMHMSDGDGMSPGMSGNKPGEEEHRGQKTDSE